MSEFGKVTAEDIFADGGEMGALMRSHDWSQTLLGPVSEWAQSLKTAVSIILNSRYPMFVWWGKAYAILYNDAYRPILGASKHPQFLGQAARDCWEEIWDVIGPLADRVLNTGESTWSENLLLLMDRYGYIEETYFTFSYSPVRDESGGIGGVFCACTETTEQILNERRLRTLRELATHTVTTVEEVCQFTTQTLAQNPADIPFALLYLVEAEGTRLAGVAGIEAGTLKSPLQVDLQKESDWHQAQVYQTGQAEIVSNLETRFEQLPTGVWNVSPSTALVMPIPQSGKSQLAGFLVLGISPRLELDDKYRGFFDLVANSVATAIANARVYEEERKRAEALAELDRAKTVFFSNVSHEFRTPLTLMLGPTEDALADTETPLPSEQRERIEVVQRNGLRLLKLVNTLLDFSRIESGRIQAVYEPTDLATFTAELASVFRSCIERANMRLIVDCSPLSEPIYVDREMWEKILLNLLSNAFKFTFEGEITVSLHSDNDQVKLAVTDTGIGIPIEEVPHLFERFHRVRGAQGRTFEGSGIGLSLVQELVKLHGGTIQVESTLGMGSCFTVSIPIGSAHLPPDRITATQTLPSTALGTAPYLEEALRWLPQEEEGERGGQGDKGTRGQGDKGQGGQGDKGTRGKGNPQSLTPNPQSLTPRILLADDNADMRDYVRRLLSQRYNVEAVSDGVAALVAIRQNPPDLVLTDVMMPGIDGFELLQQLRADIRTREIPVILLSARAGEESRVEGLAAGADDYLTKPFSANELLARVEANLQMARLRQEATRREQQLRIEAEATRERLEDVLASIKDQFLVLDREWRYTFVNDRVVEVVGIAKEDLLGKSIWEVFPDIVASEFYTQVHQAVAQQEIVQFEYFYPAWRRWFKNRIYPGADGVTILVTDITESRQAEIALQESEEKYRQLAEAIDQFVWTSSPQGVADYCNQYFYKYTGLSPEQTANFGWATALHPEDRDRTLARWEQAKAVGEEYEIEYRFKRGADNTYSWFLARIYPIRNDRGEIVKWIGTAIDIDDRKRAEEALLESEERSRQQAEELFRANQIKDEFLAILSHELRSPLNPILGWTKLLQRGKLDERTTQTALETIERNAKLQTQLIEDLLDVSRILRGKMVLNVAPVNLVAIVQDAMETVRLAAEAKDIQIQTVFAPEVGFISGDAARLQQIVWNLLSNAVKFTPPEGQVEVFLERVGMYAQIQVKDTGIGIKPEFLPYVFEHFRQEDGKTTRKFGGLGLGLAIVRHLTELHGGTVAAESPGEGKGATFTVKLPLLHGSRESGGNREWGVGNREELPHLPLSGLQILVVDDEADMRELMVMVLEQAGAEVRVAASALLALADFNLFKPHILISDIGMPEMDGYMLMRQIRSRDSEQGGEIPAIALTAYAGEYDQQQAMIAGFQRHLAKPVDPDELINVIVTLLKLR